MFRIQPSSVAKQLSSIYSAEAKSLQPQIWIWLLDGSSYNIMADNSR